MSRSWSLIAFRLVAVIIVTTQMLGCSNTRTGASGNVRLSDFSSKPTVRINWPEMVLIIPPSNAVGVGSVSPKVKIEGDSIIIHAKYVLSSKPRTMTFNLAKLGMAKERASSANVFWMNPDRTKQALEAESNKVGEK